MHACTLELLAYRRCNLVLYRGWGVPQSRIRGPKRNENIQRTLVELEQGRAQALMLLEGTEGVERKRVRAHLVYLELRLRWYRGRAQPKVRPEQQGYPEKKRRYARNTASLTEIQRKSRSEPLPEGEPLAGAGTGSEVAEANQGQSRGI